MNAAVRFHKYFSITEDQQTQFNLYGCVSRCIIKAAEIRNMPISQDDFVARYSHLFSKDQCGLLSIDGFCEIVKDLGLTKSVYAVRNIEKVKTYLAAKLNSNVFVFTDISIEKKESHHCCLALGYGTLNPDQVGASIHPSDEALFLYSPRQDGSGSEGPVSFSDLESQLVHFLLLSPNH